MGQTRRLGTLEVTAHVGMEPGGIDVVLEPAHLKHRVVLHFHARATAETLFPVGGKFDLLLEPVSQP